MNADAILAALAALKDRLSSDAQVLLRSAPYADDPRARDEDEQHARRLANDAVALARAIRVIEAHRHLLAASAGGL